MKGENGLIKNEKELEKSWNSEQVEYWVVNDGVGDMRNIYRENAATKQIMPYQTFKEKINYYLNQVKKGQKDAYIKEVI